MKHLEFIIGIAAPILTVGSFLPQVVKTIKTKKTRDLALPTFLVLCVSAAMWTTYGWLLHNPAIFITNAIVFSFSVLLVAYKLRFK